MALNNLRGHITEKKKLSQKVKNCDIFLIVDFGLWQANAGGQLGTVPLATLLIARSVLISVSEQN